MDAITLSHLTKVFRDFTLDNVTLSVPEGTVCGLVGENGAGKTTIIRLLMGAIRPNAGEISVLGHASDAPDFREAKEDIGIVLDEAYFPEVMTALQVGKVMRDTYRRWDMEQFTDYLRRFELPDKKPFKEYSRGMRMKLAISVALSHHAKLLVLDEATAGLDPIIRDEIIETFREFTLQDEHSILISSHIVSDLEKLCDSIAFLHRGKLLFCEEKDRLLDQYGIFRGTAEQADSLLPEAVVGREDSAYGGVRALVRRDAAPSTLTLERPTVEDVILFTVKEAKSA
ncbi:MAG: ABC transporter ATP-binding protein [Oscillospiraceae bacterium]|nr:ABC transporter ATP-binding protein [Oscillospiraceae bacterium]